MNVRCMLAVLLLLVSTQALAHDVGAARRLEAMSREIVAQQVESEAGGRPDQSALVRDRLRRIGHGFWSLVIPGWSQYRAGHDRRALAFASAELMIWGAWTFSHYQGVYREDRYKEFAQVYAGVQDVDRDDDDYWRAVGANTDSERYNDSVRRENRALQDEQLFNGEEVTVGLNDNTYSGDASWAWSSERRQIEYVDRRSDAIAAYDRRDLVLLFAVINRVLSFADAVRSGPADPQDTANALIEAGGFRVGVDFDASFEDPGATLRLGRSF